MIYFLWLITGVCQINTRICNVNTRSTWTKKILQLPKFRWHPIRISITRKFLNFIQPHDNLLNIWIMDLWLSKLWASNMLENPLWQNIKECIPEIWSNQTEVFFQSKQFILLIRKYTCFVRNFWDEITQKPALELELSKIVS